jgi:hypothetical protein
MQEIKFDSFYNLVEFVYDKYFTVIITNDLLLYCQELFDYYRKEEYEIFEVKFNKLLLKLNKVLNYNIDWNFSDDYTSYLLSIDN